MAVRCVSALSPTSTMLAWPSAPRWVSEPGALIRAPPDDTASPSSSSRVAAATSGLAHQAFADEEGLDAGARQAQAVVMA